MIDRRPLIISFRRSLTTKKKIRENYTNQKVLVGPPVQNIITVLPFYFGNILTYITSKEEYIFCFAKSLQGEFKSFSQFNIS